MIGDSVIFALAYLCLAAAQNVWMLFAGKSRFKSTILNAASDGDLYEDKPYLIT